MNFFVYWINEKGQEELLTCPTDGLIVDGITRDSVIVLAKKWGLSVVEKQCTISQLTEAIESNRVLEIFGTGTGTTICPFSQIKHKDKVNNLTYVLDLYYY